MRDVAPYIIQEFAWQWEMARNLKMDMVCVQIGDAEKSREPVPLSVSLKWPSMRSLRFSRHIHPYEFEYFYRGYGEFLHSAKDKPGFRIESVDRVIESIFKAA